METGDEFFPPLSSRTSTTQEVFDSADGTAPDTGGAISSAELANTEPAGAESGAGVCSGWHRCARNDERGVGGAASDAIDGAISAIEATGTALGAGGAVARYWRDLKEQRFVIAKAGQEVVGFLSYRCRSNNKNHVQGGVDIPAVNAYISTICVAHTHRRRGIAESLYDCLEANAKEPYIYTRTWSQNASHIKLLEKRGYSLLRELIDDRGVGVHTVYYGKAL